MKLKKFKTYLKQEQTSMNWRENPENNYLQENTYEKPISVDNSQNTERRQVKSSLGLRYYKGLNKKYKSEIEKGSKIISYVPKNNLRFVPSDISSYGNINNLDMNKTRNILHNSPKFKTQSNFNFKNPAIEIFKI